MNFKLNRKTSTATSDCGFYTITSALNNGKPWFNALYLPTKRSIEGSYDKEQCKTACELHAKRIAALKQPA